MQKNNIPGFTIIELMIVIVIIGVLAAITIVNFVDVQDRAQFSIMQSDLKSLTGALEMYRSDNSEYPNTYGVTGCTGNWCGWDQATGDNFVPGLTPKYLSKTPQLGTALASNNTYLFSSNGTDYQLIRFNPAGLSTAEKTNNLALIMSDGYENIAWGYRTGTGVWW